MNRIVRNAECDEMRRDWRGSAEYGLCGMQRDGEIQIVLNAECDEIGEIMRNTDCAECDEIGEIMRNAE